MAYQNVGTPRFYVNDITYSRALGIFEDYTDYSQGYVDRGTMADGNPNNPFTDSMPPTVNRNLRFKHINYVLPYNNTNNRYYAILGHNFKSANKVFRHHWLDETYPTTDDDNGTTLNSEVLVNGTIGTVQLSTGNSHSPFLTPEYDGFSIVTFHGGTQDAYYEKSNFQIYSPYGLSTTETVHVGDIFLGNYYDMSHSPDLSLKLSYDYDGIKTQQTKGGATLSNALYTKPADWGDYGCWQLGDNPNYRSGRRSWDLSFSYLSSDSVFPVNASTSYAATVGSETGYGDNAPSTNTHGTEITSDDTYEFSSNILTGTDFFSQVWNKTMGGHLPFIFQPDNTNANPDQFAICRFDMDSLQYDQVAHNTYNVKLKIRESW
tara:strand:- start:184 stop:1311 length:1128 start_codon:yes stop_codon:yes gene_type:complete